MVCWLQPNEEWENRPPPRCLALQREAVEYLIRDLPLQLVSMTDEEDFYLALLQVGSSSGPCYGCIRLLAIIFFCFSVHRPP
jgi:hypothetical protein